MMNASSLALAPGAPVAVGRRAVVEDPPVRGPGPAPLGRHPGLFGAGLAPRGLVDAVLVDAGVDPAAAQRGAVVLHLGERGQRSPGCHLVPVDLLEDVFGARLVV